MQAPITKSQNSSSPRGLAATIGTNTFFSMGASVAQVATRLVTIPVVISHLGLAGYGIWSIIMTAAAYMRFGSVGVKCAFQKYVAEATGDGDYDRACRLLTTGCVGMFVLSVVGLIPIVVFAPRLALAAGVPAAYLSDTAASIGTLAFIMVVSNAGAVFEAIVLGGHRIDLARQFTMYFTVAEAVAIVVVIHFGYGLVAMSWIMALSEMGFVLCCCIAARAVLPQIRLSPRYMTTSVLGELTRFAGSYQVVNVLEVVYSAILPFVVLRYFGATSAGTYAIVSRLVASALMIQNAFLLPLLSGGTMVYASGSIERMRTLLIKAFKVNLGLTLFPMAFISIFGADILYAWTGEHQAVSWSAFAFISAAGLFSGFSMLQLVLYRVTGRALMDNIRQVLRIAVIAVIAVFAQDLGFTRTLAGLAIAELAGAVFMLTALSRAFSCLPLYALMSDAGRLSAATLIILVGGVAATHVPLLTVASARTVVLMRVAKAGLACLVMAWPALALTRSVSQSEKRALLAMVMPALQAR